MIAAEKTGRASLLMEIDPNYCDVILQRWAEFTKADPVRDDGVKWSDLVNEL
jgi:DNA modification methylase